MSENPFTDGQQFSAARLNSMYNAHQNEGVLNGLDVSTSVNAFDVDVASGELFLNNDVVSVGSATLSLSTSDPEDRIDLISADSTGLTVTQGNPAATSGQPIAPDIPSGDVLVSLIYVRGGSSEILTGDIFNDYRVSVDFTPPDFISPQGESSGLDADLVRGGPPVESVNGDVGDIVLFPPQTDTNTLNTGDNTLTFTNDVSPTQVSVTQTWTSFSDSTEGDITTEVIFNGRVVFTDTTTVGPDLSSSPETFTRTYVVKPDFFRVDELTVRISRSTTNVSLDSGNFSVDYEVFP